MRGLVENSLAGVRALEPQPSLHGCLGFLSQTRALGGDRAQAALGLNIRGCFLHVCSKGIVLEKERKMHIEGSTNKTRQDLGFGALSIGTWQNWSCFS